jgi:G3E family GTPase
MHPSARYILDRQIAESDWIVASKADRFDDGSRKRVAAALREVAPDRPVYWVSAESGEGVDRWLDDALHATNGGSRVVDVDYDTYAEGEALLGWLNASMTGQSATGVEVDWRMELCDLLERLRERFHAAGDAVGHMKARAATGDVDVVANVTATDTPTVVRGDARTHQADVTLNLRVEMTPERLESIVREMLGIETDRGSEAPGQRGTRRSIEWRIHNWRCLAPGRPEPTHRYLDVVPAR